MDKRGFFSGFFNCDDGPPVNGHWPSITAMFESVARYYGRQAVEVAHWNGA
ncbi:MAG: hypothetical protein AAF171_28205 [Cyanobacteria bacterium P01_A01_bin.116]